MAHAPKNKGGRPLLKDKAARAPGQTTISFARANITNLTISASGGVINISYGASQTAQAGLANSSAADAADSAAKRTKLVRALPMPALTSGRAM